MLKLYSKKKYLNKKKPLKFEMNHACVVLQKSLCHLSLGVDDVHHGDAARLPHVLDGRPLPLPYGSLEQVPL